MSPHFIDASPRHWREVRAGMLARGARRCTECGDHCKQGKADVHHLIPRAAGGADEAAHLITLGDGCHAVRQLNLQDLLARRTIARWGVQRAKWLDGANELVSIDESLDAALHLH